MHFAPNDEQQAFLTGLRRLLNDLGGPALVREAIRQPSGVHPELWELLGEVGVLGLPVAEERGGQGGGWLDACLALEVLAERLVDGPVLMHMLAVMIVQQLTSAGAPLPDGWLDGSQRLTVALAEAEGAVPFVVGADAVLVAQQGAWKVLALGADGVQGEVVHVLDPSWRGGRLSVTDAAWARTETVAACSPQNLQKARDLGVCALACCQAGMARAVVAMTTEYARNRRQFNRPIGSFQAVQHHCADMFTTAETMRSAAWHAAYSSDHLPDQRADHAAIAGSWCGEGAMSVAATAIQVHGGIGFTDEHDCHLFFKRASVTRRLFGEGKAHRRRLAATAGL